MVRNILNVFPDARIHSGYARVKCPYHKGGQERRPSMGILLEPRGDMPAGTCHCFACGKVVTIEELFAYVGAKSNETVFESTQQSLNRLSLHITPELYKPQLPYKFSSYLKSRGISKKTQKQFKVYQKDEKVFMPVFNRAGKYLFVNARSIKEKLYFVEGGAVKTLWGIEEIDLSRPIVVCEGQIDAMSLWEVGIQAVATLGAGNISALKDIMTATSIIILAFDTDEAGLKAREKAVKMLGKFRCKYLDLPVGVDINKALVDIQDSEQFKEFIRKITKKT